MKARDHRSQSLKLLEIRLMLPPSSFRCEMRAHTHTHTHTHTERTSRLVFAVTRFQRALFTGAKEMPSEQHNHAATNPFRLVVFIDFGLTTVQSAISLSSAGHKLPTEFPLGLGFPP